MTQRKTLAGLVGAVAAVAVWLAYDRASDSQDLAAGPASHTQQAIPEPSAHSSNPFSPLPSASDRTSDNEPQQIAAASEPAVTGDEPEADNSVFDVGPIQAPITGFDIDYSAVGNDEGTIDGQPSRGEIAARLDERFSSEPYDDGWAGETESTLSELFANTGLEGSYLAEAACRSTLCRIDVTHVDSTAEERFVAAFAANARFVSDDQTGFYFRSVDYNGVPRTVFFWARQGYELSDPAL